MTDQPDFRAILSKPVADVKKPKALPPGTFHGRILSREYGQSSKKKTNQVVMYVGGLMPGEDIDVENLADIDMTKKTLRATYYLTDAAEYRVVELAVSCGIPTDGMSMGQMIDELVNQPVLVTVTQRNSEDGKDVFNDISEMVGTGGSSD